MSETAADVTGVVLAGGTSRRFENGEKALATLGGETLVERVISELTTATEQVPIVAVRTETQRDLLSRTLPAAWNVRFVLDEDELTGPLAGVLSACEAASTRWVFVVGCDMPLLTASAITGTYDRVTRTDESHPNALVPVFQGQHQPLHAVYRRSAVIESRDSLSAGDGFNTLLASLCDVDYVDVRELLQVVQTSLTNVNTVGELERITENNEVNTR